MAALPNNMVLVGILVTLVLTAHADDGTATFYAQYDRKFRLSHNNS